MTRRLPAAAIIILALCALPGTVLGEIIDLTKYEPQAGTSLEDLQIGRVSFFDGKLLGAEDFQDEQQYVSRKGRVRIAFEEVVRDLSLGLAAADNGGNDAFFQITIEPGSDLHDPVHSVLGPGKTGTVDIEGGPIREVVIDASTDAGDPAAFGVRGIEFATSVPQPTSIVLVLAGLGLAVRALKAGSRPR